MLPNPYGPFERRQSFPANLELSRASMTIWKGVLFDLDGTLADTLDLTLRCFRYAMNAHLKKQPPINAFMASMGRPLPLQMSDYARSEAERLAMLDTFVSYQDKVHDAMVEPFSGAVSTLRALRKQGSRVGIVTSKGHRIGRRTIEVCGLDKEIEFVVFGNEVEQPKPHPEAVFKALEALGLSDESSSVLFVGDSPHDIRAGRSAGTKTAAVTWGGLDRKTLVAENPDFFIDTLGEILKLDPS